MSAPKPPATCCTYIHVVVQQVEGGVGAAIKWRQVRRRLPPAGWAAALGDERALLSTGRGPVPAPLPAPSDAPLLCPLPSLLHKPSPPAPAPPTHQPAMQVLDSYVQGGEGAGGPLDVNQWLQDLPLVTNLEAQQYVSRRRAAALLSSSAMPASSQGYPAVVMAEGRPKAAMRAN